MSRIRIVFLCLLAFLLACSPAEEPAVSADSPVPDLRAASSPAGLPSPEASRPSPELPAKTLVFAADPWCPHNCIAGSEHEGYMVDLAREIFEEAGYRVEYVNISWARALRLTREGTLDAVVGAFRGDAPDFVFPEVPQGRSRMSFYTHPDNNWVWKGIDSLEGQSLVGINSYSYSLALDSYISRHQGNVEKVWILSGPSPLPRAVELLERKRMDVFVGDSYVMTWFLNTEKPDFRPRLAGVLNDTPAYLAFSPKRKDAPELATILSAGTRQRIENGRMAEILARYGLEEPE